MTANIKAMGSLSSSLLARKGQARPAMRSQGFGGFGGLTQGLDDLGWNDMGAHAAVPAPMPEPAPAPAPVPAPESAPEPEPATDALLPAPPVLVEREALKAAVEAPAAVRSVSVPTATRLARETQHQAKVAFTLRVDSDRHLKLRIASALTNRSAQDLVTQALDALIDSIPEVATLVAQLPRAAAPKSGRKR
jgi:hypothetical protein